MKKTRTWLCILVIAACIPGIIFSAQRLPADAKPLIEEKYAGWSGVIRVWAFEGWTGGDKMAAWVNHCAASFEKSHPGVYVQVTYPGAEAVRTRSRSGVKPPDAILFPPGLLDSPEGLAPLDGLPVRESLALCGQGYAAPVALGGYAWAVNARAEGAAVPADGEWRSFSRAAAALGDPGAIIEETLPEPPGIDLGLPASARTPMESFTAGELGAVVVTQRELASLERLRGQARGPEWTLRTGARAWTDQVIYMAVPDGAAAPAMELLDHLLTPECQSLLAKQNLFSVLDAPTGCAPGSCMEQMDLSLLRQGLTAAHAFNDKREP